MAMQYNPKTGKWSSVANSSTKNTGNTGSSKTKSSSSNLVASTSDTQSSTGATEQKYNTINYNILEGTLTYIATKDTIKLHAGDTVLINGIGKYLSGLYYVKDVTRQISRDGYSHSATILKTDFGDNIKSTTGGSVETPTTAKKTYPQTKKVATNTGQRIHILKRGECLWTVARMYYGSGAQYPKIAKANNISPSQYRRLPNGLRLIIP